MCDLICDVITCCVSKPLWYGWLRLWYG